MKNIESWTPTKYVMKNGCLVSSNDKGEVGVGSRMMTNIIARFYQKYIPLYAKGKLLDLGCGKVPLYGLYKKYVVENICVDWGNTIHKNEYLDYECDLSEVLPFANGEFDTIIISDVLEHIPRPEQLWMEMHRILAVDGTVICNVPFFYWLHETPHDYYRYSEFALKRFVDGAGLELEKLEATGGSPEVLTDILAKHFKLVPLVGSGLALAIQYMTLALMNVSLFRGISIRTSKLYPYGYFLVAKKKR